jgi:DNA-binding CsgD family transcriptional regulator
VPSWTWASHAREGRQARNEKRSGDHYRQSWQGTCALITPPSGSPILPTRELSPREEEIVELCVEGLTNDAIADRLGLSVGTVNTYWLRIKLKVGGSGRTDTVVKVIRERAERALRDANIERKELAEIVAERERGVIELRAALALLHLAMDQIKSTVWATDKDLTIRILANGEFPSTHFGVKWEIGKTVYEIFKTVDSADLAVAAHLRALTGFETELRLAGEFANMFLRVLPLIDEVGEVMGCISILNSVGE